MFINNNRPSQNRQLLIRWAAKEINCDSSFFVWSEKIITTILLSLISLSSLELTGEVRRSDRQTDWLTVFKHPAVQHPSCVVRSHQTWQGQSQSQEHSLIRSKKWRWSSSQLSKQHLICCGANWVQLIFIWKANWQFALLARPYLNIKTQMSLYQRSKFLTKHGQHLSLLPPNPSLARHLLAAAS